MSLSGKVAIVTGSTSGIGFGIAQALARQGVHVMLNGFGEAGLVETIRTTLESDFNIRAAYNGADLTKADQIGSLIEETVEKLGSVDILVNNAGIQHVSPVDTFPPDKWEMIIALNLVACFHTIRHAVPHMKKNGWGRIINIASALAVVASPFKSA